MSHSIKSELASLESRLSAASNSVSIIHKAALDSRESIISHIYPKNVHAEVINHAFSSIEDMKRGNDISVANSRIYIEMMGENARHSGDKAYLSWEVQMYMPVVKSAIDAAESTVGDMQRQLEKILVATGNARQDVNNKRKNALNKLYS